MAIYGEPRVWLSQFPLGEPQTLACDYQGIRYPGEVVRADIWSPDWGEPLTGDVYFRIVLLQQPLALTPPLQDSRIALCLPGTEEHRQRERLAGELSTIRQAQALYLTQRDPEADLIRRTLQLRQEGLEEELVAQEVTRYATGTILVASEPRTYSAGLIAGTDPVSWFSRIARWLLEQAYPSLPLKVDLLPRPITYQDAAHLYAALFRPTGPSAELLSELGPALGLPPAEGPAETGLGSSPALEVITSYLSAHPQPAAWPELHYHLAHRVGLTRPLATLYLLLFLRQHPIQFEVRLFPSHQLALAEGQPLPGARLTADLLPALSWDDRLADWARSIGPLSPPDWNDTLPYLAGLCPDLTPTDDPDILSTQEQRLLQEVRQLAQDVARCQQLLGQVEQRAGATLESARRLSQCLSRLAVISGADFQSIYQAARQAYADHRMLEQDLGLFRQLRLLGHSSQQVQAAWNYLDNAVVPPEVSDLSIEKRGLEAALSPESLLRFPRPWRTLAHQVANFKDHYATAYRAHHRRVNQDLPAYEYNWNSGQLKLRALELLNTLQELGEPARVEVLDLAPDLAPRLSHCPVAVRDLNLEESPWCEFCHLDLEQTLPTEALSRLLIAIDAALSEKNRRLSNLLVERIIQGRMDQRLEDFLKIVQASDLSALSNTISEELVDFIRRILI